MISREESRIISWEETEAMCRLVGRKLTRRKDGKQESRWVYDRTLGNSICWIDRWKGRHETPWEEFKEWMKDAKITGC